MVITQIIGGLGNQMFRYAVGRALAQHFDRPLRLDISGFPGYDLHQGFELLRVFDCSAQIATESEVRNILGWQYPSRVRRVVARQALATFRPKDFIVEPYFHYWPGIKNVPHDCYLAGYWQSEKYFLDVASEIRKDFTFKAPLTSKNAALAEQIAKVNSVSLHVRRGDYVSHPKTNANHGVCSLDYYRAAIRLISERVERPHFFVFSDDIAWVKDNLRMDFPCQYVEHNQGADSFNDMRLMSLCQHQIIANSSFSWWGAWLNKYPEKIVIAPKKWFANSNNVKDLFPQTWVTL